MLLKALLSPRFLFLALLQLVWVRAATSPVVLLYEREESTLGGLMRGRCLCLCQL